MTPTAHYDDVSFPIDPAPAFSAGWREVCRWHGCEPSVEPDPVTPDPLDAAARQALKRFRGDEFVIPEYRLNLAGDGHRERRRQDDAGGRGVILSDETYLPHPRERTLRTQENRRQGRRSPAPERTEPEHFVVLRAVAYRLSRDKRRLCRRLGVRDGHDRTPPRAGLRDRREARSDQRESRTDQPPSFRFPPGLTTPYERPRRPRRPGVTGSERRAGR